VIKRKKGERRIILSVLLSLDDTNRRNAIAYVTWGKPSVTVGCSDENEQPHRKQDKAESSIVREKNLPLKIESKLQLGANAEIILSISHIGVSLYCTPWFPLWILHIGGLSGIWHPRETSNSLISRNWLQRRLVISVWVPPWKPLCRLLDPDGPPPYGTATRPSLPENLLRNCFLPYSVLPHPLPFRPAFKLHLALLQYR